MQNTEVKASATRESKKGIKEAFPLMILSPDAFLYILKLRLCPNSGLASQKTKVLLEAASFILYSLTVTLPH
jgi:hypothetical protein